MPRTRSGSMPNFSTQSCQVSAGGVCTGRPSRRASRSWEGAVRTTAFARSLARRARIAGRTTRGRRRARSRKTKRSRPLLLLAPAGMRRLPMPDTRTQLTHGHSLSLQSRLYPRLPTATARAGEGSALVLGEEPHFCAAKMAGGRQPLATWISSTTVRCPVSSLGGTERRGPAFQNDQPLPRLARTADAARPTSSSSRRKPRAPDSTYPRLVVFVVDRGRWSSNPVVADLGLSTRR